MVKCYLSGTPECKFGLNDKILLDNEAKAKKTNARRAGSGIEIDDVSFHQCAPSPSLAPPLVGRSIFSRATLPPHRRAPSTWRLLAQVSDGDTALDKAEFWEHGKCEELLKQAVTAA